jgi:hypothetical protein
MEGKRVSEAMAFPFRRQGRASKSPARKGYRGFESHTRTTGVSETRPFSGTILRLQQPASRQSDDGPGLRGRCTNLQGKERDIKVPARKGCQGFESH